MSQQTVLCAICHQRPATRRYKMKLGTRITGYYVVATTYRTSYAQFPICEVDYQVIKKIATRRSLGTAGFFFGMIIGLFACISLSGGIYSGDSLSIAVLACLSLGLAAVIIVSTVVGLRANSEFNKYKALVQQQMAQAAPPAPAPTR